MIEVDTDGLYFVPARRAASEDALIAELAAVLPRASEAGSTVDTRRCSATR